MSKIIVFENDNHMAGQKETDALVKAIEDKTLLGGLIGENDWDSIKFHQFCRINGWDGWYLFGVSKEDVDEEYYVVLDSELQPFLAPYNRLLDINELRDFLLDTDVNTYPMTVPQADEFMKEQGIRKEFALNYKPKHVYNLISAFMETCNSLDVIINVKTFSTEADAEAVLKDEYESELGIIKEKSALDVIGEEYNGNNAKISLGNENMPDDVEAVYTWRVAKTTLDLHAQTFKQD